MPKGDLKRIKLTEIRENPDALRSVNVESEEFVGLVDSIKSHGVLNAVNVRERYTEDGTLYYELVDGLQRFTASKAAGCEDIPAQIVDLSETEVYEAQIIANVHKIETRPVEYTKALIRILGANPTLTISQLAGKIGKSGTWLNDRLSLTKLDPKVQELVNEGKIPLSNAYPMTKLPCEEQLNYIDSAMTMSSIDFSTAVTQRAHEIRAAARQGKSAGPAVFAPMPRYRTASDTKAILENPSEFVALIAGKKFAKPEDAAIYTIKWVLQVDDDSVEVEKAKWEAAKAAREEAKKKREAEREAAKLAKAAEAAAAATVAG